MPPPPSRLSLRSAGHAVVLHADGSVSTGGGDGATALSIAPGDQVVLLPSGTFSLPLRARNLRSPAGKALAVQYQVDMLVTDAELLVTRLVQADLDLTAQEIGQRLSAD